MLASWILLPSQIDEEVQSLTLIEFVLGPQGRGFVMRTISTLQTFRLVTPWARAELEPFFLTFLRDSPHEDYIDLP